MLELLQNPTVLTAIFVIGIILVLYIVLLIWRAMLRKGYKLPAEFEKVILQISVPRESGSLDQAQNSESSAQKIQEQIAWAENLWASFGSLKPMSGLKAWLYGRHDEISLEIVAKDSMIYFYVIVPKFLHSYTDQQISSQYPHAQVEIIDDYNIFNFAGSVSAAALNLSKQDIFPLKTYRQMEVDPLNALTNNLSKLNEHEGAVIQLILRPVDDEWYAKGRKVVSEVLQGADIKQAINNSKSLTWYEKIGSGAGKGISEILSSGTNKEDKPELPKPTPTISPMAQESMKNIEQKSSKAGMEASLRVVVSSNSSVSANSHLQNIVNAFSQFSTYEYGNSFNIIKNKKVDTIIKNFIHREFFSSGFVLNTEEIASLFHFPLASTPTPNIHWLGARKASAPVNLPQAGIILGKNLYRGKESLVRIKQDDRRRHVYIVGMTGTGKSTLMVNMAVQDIQNGEGVCYIDPHGNGIEEILPTIPQERLKDVVYFDPADTEMPIGLNMLDAQTPEAKDFAVQEMISIFYKIVTDPQMLGPMFEHYMRNAMLLLMSDPDDPGTIVEIPRVFVDEDFRQAKLNKCSDILVKSFWEKEYAASQRGSTGADMLSYVISKVGRFIENEMMRNIIGQPKSGLDIREIMDNKKILLVNLSKGKVGEVNSDLLGLIFVSKLQMAALSRADMPESQRNDFYLYIDEFQNYVTNSISTILAEARKYRLNMTMAHQYIGQLTKNNDSSVKDAVFGNAGTIVCYRVGVEDAEFLAKQFAPVFNEFDLINIEKYNAYIRLLIDNSAARPFNMATLIPVQGDSQVAHTVTDWSRRTYGRPKSEVETEILRRSKLGETESAGTNDSVDMR